VVHGATGAVLFRPFRAREFLGAGYPGRRCALPWAVISRPFRPESGRVHSVFLECRPVGLTRLTLECRPVGLTRLTLECRPVGLTRLTLECRSVRLTHPRSPIETPKGRKMKAQGNALGERRERRQALKGRNKTWFTGPPMRFCFALSGLANFWGRVTQGVAALCPGLSYPGLSGLNHESVTVYWQADLVNADTYCLLGD